MNVICDLATASCRSSVAVSLSPVPYFLFEPGLVNGRYPLLDLLDLGRVMIYPNDTHTAGRQARSHRRTKLPKANHAGRNAHRDTPIASKLCPLACGRNSARFAWNCIVKIHFLASTPVPDGRLWDRPLSRNLLV